jgi:HSP20 family protein
MANEKNVEQQNQTQSGGQNAEQMRQAPRNQQPGQTQPRQQGQRGGLARRQGEYFPSLFSLSPQDFFSASPFELMRRFTDEMDRAFSGFGQMRGSAPVQDRMWSPAIEVFEREGQIIARADLPGLNKDDVKVELTDDGLIIQGERKHEHEQCDDSFCHTERSFGRFYRLIPLPEDVDPDRINAQFNNGVLEVTVPVPERQRRRREIQVGTGGGEQSKATSSGSTKG